MAAPRPLLLGHRGCRGAEAENTFAAFDRALADGCDGFEFDVRRSSDGRNVVCHDSRFRGLEISAHTFDELTANSARSKFGLPRSKAPQDSLPCLEEVLERYGTRAFLDIELKVEGMEAATLAAIRRAEGLKGYFVSSFLPEVVQRLAELDSAAPVGFIFDTRRAMELWSSLSCTWVMPNYKLVTQELVRIFHEAGKQVMVWTVNKPADMQRMAAMGVDAVIADDTSLLRSALGTFIRGDQG